MLQAQSIATSILRTRVGILARYTPRQKNQAGKPERRIPITSATALCRPIDAIMPSGLNENGRVGRLFSTRARFSANCFAWRVANCAVVGLGFPSQALV